MSKLTTRFVLLIHFVWIIFKFFFFFVLNSKSSRIFSKEYKTKFTFEIA